MLKFSKASRKETLLIESGIRLHTTNFVRNKKDIPSGFSMKVFRGFISMIIDEEAFEN